VDDLSRRPGAIKDPARRTFTPLTPLLFAFRAVVVLVVFGGFWLSVRGQHPYTGDISGWAIAVAIVLVLVLINVGWTAWAIACAGTGVSGPAQRQRQAWKVFMVGDALTFSRLQDILGLTPGNLITALRKLEEADYLASTKTGSGSASKTTVVLTRKGRAALGAFTRALRDLLGGLDTGIAADTDADADGDHVAF